MFVTILAVLLIALGAVALAYRSLTFFTKEKVLETDPLDISVSRPRTVFFHPAAGTLMLVTGVVMLLVKNYAA